MRYLEKKIKGKNKGTFLGTHRFVETWGLINPAKMQSFVESKIPKQSEWTESPREIHIVKTKMGIRFDATDGRDLDTVGPVSFIPRMMAAVCSIPSLMDHAAKRPVIALMSYDAIEMSDGQVPAPSEKVEFFISLIRFNNERKATLFSANIIQLWESLRAARRARLEQGLSDAKLTKQMSLSEDEKSNRRKSVSHLTGMNQPANDDESDGEDQTIEVDDSSGYLEVHAFGMG